MTTDRTEHQSQQEIDKSRALSLAPSQPPAQVPGYSIENLLGRGSYGEVWSATDKKTGRRVAIKFFNRRAASDVMLMAGEVEKLAVLAADRYVVQLLDVGWDADPPFYVMNYIEHGSLEDRMKGARPISTAEAIELFQEICQGMMHLHGKGILHCDLKPGNILLDQDGKPRVADFGQSRLESDQTASLGTLFFMAPEQANLDAAPDARWDVYSLGALIFSMLTGKPPYYHSELASEIESTSDVDARLDKYQSAIMNAPRPTAHRDVPGVDRALAEIIDRCIAADSKKRFASVQSVLMALKQRELTKARQPLIVLGLLGPVLLLAVMTIFGWRAYRRAINDTDAAITSKAIESNKFAARLAARSASEKVDEYFRVVKQLVREPEFVDTFKEVLADSRETRGKLSHPDRNRELDELRQSFVEDDVRKRLQPFLASRMENVLGEYPDAASWFVNDRQGTQLASVYSHDSRNTIGKNYSYRSYFTGRDRDLRTDLPDGTSIYDVPDNPADREIIDRPHLSAIFLSEGSNTWKFAFSAPIVEDGQTLGIAALTVDMGNLVEFNTTDVTGNERPVLQYAPRQYAMLVDGRSGENQGVVLEHPLFASYLRANQRIPDSLVRTVVASDFESLNERETFRDPIGRDPVGEAFDRDLVVGKAKVFRTETDPGNGKETSREATGLFVLAVEDYSSVLGPAHRMGRSLGWMAVWTALLLLVVAIGMWLLVLRMIRDSRQRLSRFFSPSTGSSSALEEMETLAMPTDHAVGKTLSQD